MTTYIVNTWAIVGSDGGPTPVAVAETPEDAERIALEVSVNTARTAEVEPSPLTFKNARLKAGLCPECGSRNIHKYRVPVPGDPGDVDGAADCLDCGWGY